MSTCPYHRLDRSVPWKDDGLDAACEPETAPPVFDTGWNAWIISRYAEVLFALDSPDLTITGPTSTKPPVVDEPAHLAMRAETRDALPPAMLRATRRTMLARARALVPTLEDSQPVDLLADYAAPLCLQLALQVTRPAETLCVEELCSLAAQVSSAAAQPFDSDLKTSSKRASAALEPHFHHGPEALRSSGFIALSQTLVHLLGNMWLALIEHPAEWARLHREPTLLPRGIEELLRFAGLTRLVFRRAVADTMIGETAIYKGDRLLLRILAANRDPLHFPKPHTFSIARRRTASQLSLGAGRFHCVGAPLIRVAAIALTLPLIDRLPALRLSHAVQWKGGDGFRSPVALPVVRASQPSTQP